MNQKYGRVFFALLRHCLSTFKTKAQTVSDIHFGKGLHLNTANSSSPKTGPRFQLLNQEVRPLAIQKRFTSGIMHFIPARPLKGLHDLMQRMRDYRAGFGLGFKWN